MNSQVQIQALEGIIVQYAGPVGKFVIKKSITDLGLDQQPLSPETKTKLVEMVLARAVFDKDRWDAIRREINAAWGD